MDGNREPRNYLRPNLALSSTAKNIILGNREFIPGQNRALLLLTTG